LLSDALYVEIEVVGAKRRFGAEMCVASAGMRRRLEGRRCEVEVPVLQVRFACNLRQKSSGCRGETAVETDLIKTLQRDMFVCRNDAQRPPVMSGFGSRMDSSGRVLQRRDVLEVYSLWNVPVVPKKIGSRG
jgi:hypothetical protein